LRAVHPFGASTVKSNTGGETSIKLFNEKLKEQTMQNTSRAKRK
jgi:hypothetical protein